MYGYSDKYRLMAFWVLGWESCFSTAAYTALHRIRVHFGNSGATFSASSLQPHCVDKAGY